MAYGRELLRKAGDALRSVDNAYSDKIVDMYMGPKDRPRNYEGKPLQGAAAGIGAIFMGGTPAAMLREGDTPSKIAAATGVAAKYVAPAVATGVALQGALDMANVLSQQTSGTLEPN